MEQESHTLDEVIEFCQQQNLNSVMIGSWIWVKFTRKPAENIRTLLKDFGFCWSKRRGMWAHNCGHPSQPGKEPPWRKYQCSEVSGSVHLED